VVLLCVPAGEPVSTAESEFLDALRGVPVLWLETKADLAAPGAGRPPADDRVADRVRVSVRSGEGVDTIERILPRLVYAGVATASPEAPVLTRARQRRGLEAARSEIDAFVVALRDGLPAEVASSHLRAAETALEDLLGTISTEAVLDVVFAEFCVGK
jgi:tRNA modification GTPase